MSRLSICFISREYAHPKMGNTGGIGVFLRQYLEHLSQVADVTVFSFGNDKVEFNDGRVKIFRIKDFSTKILHWQSIYLKTKLPGYITLKLVLAYINRQYLSVKLRKFVRNNEFDLLEFHDYGGDAAYYKTSVPFVTRCHGSCLTLHEFMGYHNRITDSYFEKVFFKQHSSNAIGVSRYASYITKKAFKLNYCPKVIYNGVNLPKSDINTIKTIPFSIFYFGSIRERKGIDIACNVFNLIVDDFPQATFHVLGNNNNNYWNTNAKRILSKSALNKTKYYGSIPNKDVNRYIGKAHIVLFPSFGENFSMALLEVMALGKIVITSNIQSFQEIIDHKKNGFIADCFEDYTRYTKFVFNKDFELNTISEEAKHTIETKYTWSKVIPQNIEFYSKVINEYK